MAVTLTNVNPPRGGDQPPSIGHLPDALPDVLPENTPGETRMGLDFGFSVDPLAYVAMHYVVKRLAGKNVRRLQPLVPNLLFVYATPQKADSYAKDNPRLPYVSYYYDHFSTLEHDHTRNSPLTIPESDMFSFVLATSTRSEHLLVVAPEQCHFKGGDLVRVTAGAFAGVTGRVARVAGQQRVVIQLTGLGLISTAYIPTAFIQKV